EGAVKGGLRLIADFSGDLCDTIARGCEQLRAELKPPASEIRNGGLREITPEPLGQYGTRNPYFVRKCVNRPRMGRLAMQQSQGFSDFRIADPGQPTVVLWREQRHIASQCFDEQD